MADAFWLTNSLVVGVPENISRSVTIATPEEGVQAIRDGKVAVITNEDWEVAREILRSFGLNDSQISRREQFARTGMLP